MKRLSLLLLLSLFTLSVFSQAHVKLLNKGKEQYRKRNYEKALEYFHKSKKKKYNADALLWIGNVYLVQDKYDEALKYIDYGINRASSYFWGYQLKGVVYHNQGNYTEAIKWYNKSLSKKSFYANYSNRGKCYLRLRKPDEALKDLKKSMSMHKDNRLYRDIAECYMLKGNRKLAEKNYTNAVNSFSRNPSYRYSRGLFYLKSNMISKAETDANHIMNTAPADWKGYTLMGNVHMAKRRYQKAILMYQKATAYGRGNSYPYTQLAKAYVRMHKFNDALEAINSALKSGETPYLLLQKGRLYYFGLEDKNQANIYFRKVANKYDYMSETSPIYANVFLGNKQKAFEQCNTLLAKKAKNITFWDYYNVTCIYALSGDEKTAFKYLDKCFAKGFRNVAHMANDSDIDNLKYRKKYSDLLKKYNIKYEFDNLVLVQAYVKTAVMDWQKRGKYEKSSVYYARVNKKSREKKIEAATKEAIQQIGRQRIKVKIKSTDYDPDKEVFKLNLGENGTAYINVPVSEAEQFDKNLYRVLCFPVFGLNSKKQFVIDELMVSNPANSKTYNYRSSNRYDFSSKDLVLDFEPINVKSNIAVSKQPSSNQNNYSSTGNSNTGKSSVDYGIPVTNSSRKNTFALVIGNEDYTSYQIDLNSSVNVDYAENDARVFKKYLTRTLGVPEDNVTLLINATAGQMKQAIAKLSTLARVLSGEAELILFYAGHGLPDEKTKESYLMPVDISGLTIEYAVKLKDMYSQLSQHPTKRTLVFLDACFSGGGRNKGLVSMRGLKIRPKQSSVKGNMVVFTSSSGSQSSATFKDKKHGMFTYYLLEKLKNSKGNVRLNDLGKYIKTNVQRQSVLINNKEQTPNIIVDESKRSTVLNSTF